MKLYSLKEVNEDVNIEIAVESSSSHHKHNNSIVFVKTNITPHQAVVRTEYH